jgi:hypothetical protein
MEGQHSEGNAATLTTFPTLLHCLLSDLENNGESYIASYQPHGFAFKIHKQTAFVAIVLPR